MNTNIIICTNIISDNNTSRSLLNIEYVMNCTRQLFFNIKAMYSIKRIKLCSHNMSVCKYCMVKATGRYIKFRYANEFEYFYLTQDDYNYYTKKNGNVRT